MSKETNQPSSTSNVDELVEQIRGKLWDAGKILSEPGSLKEEGLSKDEFLKRAGKASKRKQLLDLLLKVQICIREHEDPKRAWWLFFEAAFDGLEVQPLNGSYLLKYPTDRITDYKEPLARKMLYLFTHYVASPPSMEFFESMLDGWIYCLSKPQY